jgi:hypothetical protein
MALGQESLHPFKSFLLCETSSKEGLRQIVDSVIEEMTGLFEGREHISGLLRGAAREDGDLQTAFLYYKELARTAWTSDPEFLDTINHLAVVCRLRQQFAIYSSDAALLRRVRKLLGAKKPRSIIAKLQLISAGRLNAAFIKGETQALWLSGTHRRVASKVDNKVITGLDLRYALDPLGDQSYFFTAARCRTPLGAASSFVGLSPRKSFLWAGQSSSWSDFVATVSVVLKRIGSQRRLKLDPFPVIASSVGDATSRRSVQDAYDAALIPPEITDPVVDEESRRKAENWSQLRFEIKPGIGSNFSARLSFPGESGLDLIGTATFEFDLTAANRLDWTVTVKSPPKASRAIQARLADALAILSNEKKWLKVWYESGHVLAEQDIFHLRYREFPFRNYVWADLKDYKRDQEKPKPLTVENIGKDKSLFSWVKNYWRPGPAKGVLRGWLASNDGSMEIADFIHLDDTADPPALTLIHVKGANSYKPGTARPISVSAYEVVTAQAIKNLRHIDQELLAGNFVQRLDKRIKEAVWHNGKKVSRNAMLTALKGVTSNYIRRVIVFQPQVMRSVLETARKGRGAIQLRAKQLDTLLLSSQASCQSLGSEFYVIGDKR